MTAPPDSPHSDSGSTPPPKKSWHEAALTATPVVLTVVATALAGLSTSEMTLAQYHRSLAAQNQSKASDQWGFFQAKRLRGTAMENGFDLLPPKAKAQHVEAGDLQAASGMLTHAIQEAQKETAKVENTSAEIKKKFSTIAAASAQIEQQIRDELSKKETQATFKFFSDKQLPEVEDVKFEQADIDQAGHAIQERAPEKELDPILRRIPDADLQRAIETAEGNGRRFEEAGKSVGKVLDPIDQLARDQVALAAEFHKSARDFRDSAGQGSSASTGKNSADQSSVRSSFDKADAAVQEAAEDLDQLIKALRYSYNARRQRRESDYHLKTAALYEVQVHLSSFASDRHRTRSKMFFFGMLAAQAGVTIASLSLAVHKRNVLWALAGFAGIAAIIFSGYVYLAM